MHPIFSEPRRLISYLLAWLPAGLLLALPFARAEGGTPKEALLVALPLSALSAFICLAAWYPCKALPLRETSISRLVVAFAGAAAFSCVIWIFFGWQWVMRLSGLEGMEFAPSRFARQLPLLAATGLLLFLLSAAVHYVLIAVGESHRAEKRALELDLLAREAQLQSLRAQVNPHFLFNVLNSITALITADPARARQMCVLLSDFLRLSLRAGERERHPLDEEIALAAGYLAVEQIRFGRRLKVEAWIDRSAGQVLIPPLLLQPLVENAVKHGISHLLDGGNVRIRAGVQTGRLKVEISNPCDPERPRASGGGIGLENVRRRLQSAFGEDARLDIQAKPDSFEAVVYVPISQGDPP
ncbi:MAG: histidine kinase [Acidobacteriota bacterium]